jgi:hypothetical protein
MEATAVTQLRRTLPIVAALLLLVPGGVAHGAAMFGSDAVPSASPTAGATMSPEPTGEPTVEQRLAEAEARVAALEAENDRLSEAIERFGTLYDPMEADRLLLAELRKDLPPTRAEAEAYLERLESLARISDPAQLGPPAARVIEAAPAYLEWRDQDFGTPEEASQAYAQSGAAGYDATWKLFRNAILLTVANRLDAVLSLVDRVE